MQERLLFTCEVSSTLCPVVLGEIAYQDVSIESDHRCRRRGFRLTALSAAAMVICSAVTGRGLRDLTIPPTAEAEIFGNNTTLPSGCTKNLIRSPGCSPRCSRMAFGMVAWPLTVIADSMFFPHYILANVIPQPLSARQARAFHPASYTQADSCRASYRWTACGRHVR